MFRVSVFALVGLALARALSAEEGFPGLDLRAEGPPRADASAEDGRAQARVVIRSEGAGADPRKAVRAWSLSLQVSGGARVTSATASGTDVPAWTWVEGYEKTELATSAPGVVSAVILSFFGTTSLPLSGESLVLKVDLEAEVPEGGCRACRLDFVDGLVGSGQPVRNVLTCGEGWTRRDDGGDLDDDRDGCEPYEFLVCREVWFVRGNVNGDGVVNLADAKYVLEHLFRGGPAPSCERAADADGDDAVRVVDAIYLLAHLFRGGQPPPPPYPECGVSSGASSLPCVREPACER
ncbi:MAG: hypothetical protein ACUVYA_11400 [Planctomycetota bacterium]